MVNYPQDFYIVFNEMAKAVHENAKAHGWWEQDRNDGEMLMLMVTELAEACEAIRHGNPPDDKIPAFNGAVAELADTVIRIMDMAVARGWPIGEAIVAKHEMNASRPYKHGGKKF